MKYMEVLLPIFRIFQLCGFAPFKIPLSTTQTSVKQQVSQFWQIYNGCFLIYLIVLVFFNIVSYESFLEGKASEMLTYLSYIMICGLRVLAIIVVIEPTVKNKQHIVFLQHFNEISDIFREELSTQPDYKQIRRNAFIWMTIWIAQNCILMSLIMIEVFRDYENTWEMIKWAIYAYPLVISSIKYYQIALYIKLMGYYFRMINMKLKNACSMKSRLNVQKNVKPKDFLKASHGMIYGDIVALRRIYHNLWKCTAQLNLTFRWSLLSLTGASFIIIVVNYYRTLVWVITAHNRMDEDILSYVFLSACHTFYFINLSGVCMNVLDQVCKKIPIKCKIKSLTTFLV